MGNNEHQNPSGSNGEAKCPFTGSIAPKKAAGGGTGNRDWWPNQLKLNILRQHSALSNPMVKILIMLKNLKLLIWQRLKKTFMI